MFSQLLSSEFAPYGTLSGDQLARLERHYSLLMRWNKKMNLTRITSLDDVVKLHYCESLFLARCLPAGPLKIADVGSGAGFPGIPAAILRPECAVDLIESHQRKAVFLQEAARDLANVRVIARRAEECDPGYDWMVARAVRPADVLCLRLAPKGALLVSAKDSIGSSKPIPWGVDRIVTMFHVEHG
jgi:16S rRNA (guanine527-N7)-methyltransferase